MTDQPVSAPEKLRTAHDLSQFHCGEAALDHWLRRRARQNEESGASRTYVVCAERNRVVGYHALAAGAVAHAEAPGRVKRNMPDPVPVIVLGRLAVDSEFQGRGIARGLLRDAVLRTLQASEIAGVRALLVHAISDDARRFYESCGFRESPLNRMTLMITTTEAARALV
jgi:GNAT superfamily N-acetyltransferase